MTAPAVVGGYSCDELRVLARVSEAILPAALEPGWSAEDDPVAGVVAARSLIARGALVLDGAAGPRPTTAVTGLLAPLQGATTVVELTRTDRAGAARREVLAGGHDTVLFTEREPDVWEPRPLAGPVRVAALARLAELLDEFVAVPAGTAQHRGTPQPAWGWPPDSRYRADDEAGWGRALAGLAARYLVRCAHRGDGERWELAEARWLDTGRDGLWWCEPAGDERDDDERLRAEPTTAHRVLAELAALLGTEGENQ